MRNKLLLLAWLWPALHFAQTLESPNIAIGYQDQAESFMVEEDYETATVFYKRAANIFREQEMWKQYYTCMSNLAETCLLSEDYEEAKKYAKEALWEGFKTLGQYDENSAEAAHLLAQIYVQTGQLDKAELVHKTGLGIHKALFGEDHPTVANSYYELGQFYESIGDLKAAQDWHEKGAALRRANFGSDHLDVAESLYAIANLQLTNRHFEEAIANHQKALTVRLAHLEDSDPDLVESIIKCVEALLRQGKFLLEKKKSIEQAYTIFCQADSILEAIDEATLLEAFEMGFAPTVSGLYGRAMETAFQLNRQRGQDSYLSQALVFSERSKNYAFLLAFPSGSSGRCNMALDSISRCAQVLDYNNYREAILQPRQALLEYTYHDSTFYAFTVTGSELWVDKIPIEQGFLDNLLNLKRSLMDQELVQNADSARQAYNLFINSSSTLYQQLVEPAITHLTSEVEAIVVVPDINLGLLPFEVLLRQLPTSSGRVDYRTLPYLINDYSIAYLPSISTQLDCETTKKEDAGTDLDIKPLYERASVHSTGSTRSSTEEINQKDLQLVALKAPIGGFDLAERFTSKTGVVNDYYCSACTSLVMELWEGPKQTSIDWNSRLIGRLEQGVTKDKALQQMKIHYLKDATVAATQTHPYYWAGLVIVGDSSPLFYKNGLKWGFMLALGVVLIGIFLYFFQKK